MYFFYIFFRLCAMKTISQLVFSPGYHNRHDAVLTLRKATLTRRATRASNKLSLELLFSAQLFSWGVPGPVELFSLQVKTPLHPGEIFKTSEHQSWKLCPYTSQQIGPFISGPMSSKIPQAGSQQPPGHNWATFLHWNTFSGLSNLSDIEYLTRKPR